MDINLYLSSMFVNAGNKGGVATPQSILVRSHDVAEFSGGKEEISD